MNMRGFIGSLEEITRDAQMSRGRGLDLNYPPPEQDMDITDTFVGSDAPETQAQLRGQLHQQPTNNVRVIDDEISIISSNAFSEARKNHISTRRAIQLVNDNIRLHSGYCPMGSEDGDFTGCYGPVQLTNDICFYHGYRHPEWIPVPVRIVPDPSDICTSFQVMETDKEKEVPESPEENPPVATYLNCPICLSPLSEATSTKCGHVFCKPCIEAAIKAQHKCPTCRRKLKKNNIIRIYLPAST